MSAQAVHTGNVWECATWKWGHFGQKTKQKLTQTQILKIHHASSDINWCCGLGKLTMKTGEKCCEWSMLKSTPIFPLGTHLGSALSCPEPVTNKLRFAFCTWANNWCSVTTFSPFPHKHAITQHAWSIAAQKCAHWEILLCLWQPEMFNSCTEKTVKLERMSFSVWLPNGHFCGFSGFWGWWSCHVSVIATCCLCTVCLVSNSARKNTFSTGTIDVARMLENW